MRTRLVCKIYPFAYARSSSGNVYLTAGVPPVSQCHANDIDNTPVLKGLAHCLSLATPVYNDYKIVG